MKQIVGICVGHSRSGDKGASSLTGLTEWDFNRAQARMLAHELEAMGISTVLLDRYQGNGYTAAMRWVAGELERLGATVALELHFNASDGKGQGHEWLHWSGSVNGKALAADLNAAYTEAFPEIKPRGLKPITASDRGAVFLQVTHCPAVICEPFFGDNAHDWEIASTHREKMAKAIADGIAEWLKGR